MVTKLLFLKCGIIKRWVMEDDKQNFGILLHDVARMMRVGYDRRMRPLGLTRSQWWVLNRLYFLEGSRQSDLAAELDIEKASLGRLLDRLEDKDWIKRKPDPSDRRVKRVFLTAKVEPIMRVMRAQAAETNAEALASLKADERDRMIEMLVRVRSDLADLYAPGGKPAHD
jgi:MarR family transcriptional regulator, transcriptional regulator for hemolysin